MTSKTKKITRIGVVAALYATITLVLGSISYGPIQFRISEVMTLLPLFGKEYILSLTIGCFLANVIGPYGVPDIILGTLATLISVYLVYLTGKHMKDKIIEAKNIRKKFGNSLALVDISFSIEEGQIFGFLGPSGSGKTTTINILTGQCRGGNSSLEVASHQMTLVCVELKKTNQHHILVSFKML